MFLLADDMICEKSKRRHQEILELMNSVNV